MSDAHRRKKNPELVRSSLIASAMTLALERGLSHVTVDAVAEVSGVTRGGLFYHFPNRQALVAAVVETMLADFERALEGRMEADSRSRGRFTRAYLDLSLEAGASDAGWLALWASTIGDAHLRMVWTSWLNAKLSSYGDDETGADLEAIRFAADGIWLGSIVGIVPNDRVALMHTLSKMMSVDA